MLDQHVSPVEMAVIGVLEKRGKLPANIEQLRALNYIDCGLVDSLGLMNIVVELETIFNVELQEADFLSDSFRTVGGLMDTFQRIVEFSLSNKQ